MSATLSGKIVSSPVGQLLLLATPEALVGLHFENHPAHARPYAAEPKHPVLERAARELDEYFARKRREFTVPIEGEGTPFQRRVWAALREIPYGETRSYGQLARALGNPNAMRAVGGANGRNPVAIMVPCHRVIAADGTLGGFGGGLPSKETLLALERAS